MATGKTHDYHILPPDIVPLATTIGAFTFTSRAWSAIATCRSFSASTRWQRFVRSSRGDQAAVTHRAHSRHSLKAR